MKKKLMMVAAFTGLLALGACVDNNETPSVTDVRNAKAEQYKARAEMNNAEAQAVKVLADAEAVLMTAKAEAAKANADLLNAESETIKKKQELVNLQKAAATLQNEAALIENQKAQAELQEALSNLEVTKKDAEAQLANIAANLESNRLNWEASLLSAEYELNNAKTEYDSYLESLAEAEKNKLQTLSGEYQEAVESLLEAKAELTSYQTNLIAAEEELVDVQEAKEAQIAANNQTIANYQQTIATYKEYANYMESADVDELKQKKDALYVQKQLLSDNQYAAQNAFNEEFNNVDLSEVEEAQAAIEEDAFYKWLSQHTITLKTEEGEDDIFYLDNEDCTMNLTGRNYIPYLYTWSRNKLYRGNIDEENTYWVNLGDSLITNEYKYNKDIRQIELDINANIEKWSGHAKGYQENMEKWQALYNGKATKVNGYNEEGEEIVVEIRNAVDSTAYLKNAYETETDEVKKATLRADYEEAIAYEAECLSNIEFYTDMYNMDSRKVEAMKAFLAMYDDFDTKKEALQAKIDARNEASVKAHAKALELYIAYKKAEIAYNKANTEHNAITKVLNYNGTTGAQNLNNMIKQYESLIKELESDNEDLSEVETQDQLIEWIKMRITAWEAIVAARQIEADDAKAAFDAAMPSEEAE